MRTVIEGREDGDSIKLGEHDGGNNEVHANEQFLAEAHEEDGARYRRCR